MIKEENIEKIVNQYDIDDLYLECKKLYLVADDGFISSMAERLGFPAFLEQRVAHMNQLADIKLMTPEGKDGLHKIQTYPLVAQTTFFKNMVSKEVVAVTCPTSIVVHHDLFNDKIVEKFAFIFRDKRSNLFKQAGEYDFEYWCKNTLKDINKSKEILV